MYYWGSNPCVNINIVIKSGTNLLFWVLIHALSRPERQTHPTQHGETLISRVHEGDMSLLSGSWGRVWHSGLTNNHTSHHLIKIIKICILISFFKHHIKKHVYHMYFPLQLTLFSIQNLRYENICGMHLTLKKIFYIQ